MAAGPERKDVEDGALGSEKDEAGAVVVVAAAAVADVHDETVAAHQKMKPVEGQVPLLREVAARDEAPTWYDCCLWDYDCGTSTSENGTEPQSGLGEEKGETSKAELVNHERTCSRTLLAASQ